MKPAETREELTKQIEELRRICSAFADQADRAIRHHENKGKGGMQVPYYDDFANISPAVVGQLKWWVREFRRVLNTKEDSHE